MPTKKAAGKVYRVLERGSGLVYPASRAIRERLYAGDRTVARGELKRHKVGDKITNPSSDLVKSWLRRGIVELIKKEATDDAKK